MGFATPLVSRVKTSTVFPGHVYTVAPQTVYVPLRHMLPELERLIIAFFSFPFSPLHVPASYCIWHSNVRDANDSTPACGIDRSHKFLIFPLATPTRTSSVSFEPLLPLLTYLFHRTPSSFSADAPLPRVSPGLFRIALAQWYSVGGSLDLLS